MTPEEQTAYVDAMKRTVQYKLGCTEKILNTDFYRLASETERTAGKLLLFPLRSSIMGPTRNQSKQRCFIRKERTHMSFDPYEF